MSATRAIIERRRGNRRDLFVAQLPEIARMLANGTQAGLSMPQAVRMASRELADPAGAELRRASEARTIAPGTTTVTDGPWAETREQVGGSYIIDTDDLDDLLDCCRLLAATGDAVEVRQCVSPEERPA